MASTRTSAGSSSAATSGCLSFHRSSPASASSFFFARAISIIGMAVRRRPDGPLSLPGAAGETAFRFDGWTRGCSPACFSKCGGHGASGRPAASSLAASSSS